MASSLKNLSEYEDAGIFTKDFLGEGEKIAIVVSEWNQEITANLAEAAIETLKKYGFESNDIILKSVPGSFELPLGAKMLINYQKVIAVICIGCVIQGETRHFDFICNSTANAIAKLNISEFTREENIPVSFGLLTTNTLEQAKERSGGKLGNKGVEAAIAVLKMLYLKNDLTGFDYL